MEINILISIILFYVFAYNLLNIKNRNKKYIFYVAINAILFSIVFVFTIWILKELNINIEQYDGNDSQPVVSLPPKVNKSNTVCKTTEVHTLRGEGSNCIQCPMIDGKQTVPFPKEVTTAIGKQNFDGYCGYAHEYENGQISVVNEPNLCPNEKDIPISVSSFDPKLRFCMAKITTHNIEGDSGFSAVIPDIKKFAQMPIFFVSK
jgi:hypothetical protein